MKFTCIEDKKDNITVSQYGDEIELDICESDKHQAIYLNLEDATAFANHILKLVKEVE